MSRLPVGGEDVSVTNHPIPKCRFGALGLPNARHINMDLINLNQHFFNSLSPQLLTTVSMYCKGSFNMLPSNLNPLPIPKTES